MRPACYYAKSMGILVFYLSNITYFEMFENYSHPAMRAWICPCFGIVRRPDAAINQNPHWRGRRVPHNTHSARISIDRTLFRLHSSVIPLCNDENQSCQTKPVIFP